MSIKSLNKQFDNLHAYQHNGSTIVYLNSNENPGVTGEFYKIYNFSPLLLTEVGTQQKFKALPDTIKLTISANSQDQESVSFTENMTKVTKTDTSIGPKE
jgi:hypothetical protein